MSIFNKVSELFYGRPSKFASNSTRGERGQYGEDLPADYCKRTLGFQVIVRNWGHKRYELDIVCLDAGVLVFVEVRARAASALVGSYRYIDTDKKRVLQRGSKAYINQLQNTSKHVRFNVTDVSLSDEGKGDVRHNGYVPLFSKHYTTSHESRY